jgi:2-methylcitrate dehydratase
VTFQRELAWAHIEAVERASVAYQAARYALAVDYALLPREVVHEAKRSVLDALGCAIGAYEAPGRIVCEKTMTALGGPEEATVIGSGVRTSALNAAMINSFMVRFLDYNDWGGGGHNSDALASLLAIAERERLGGADLITALVISYELGARFHESLASHVTTTGTSGGASGVDGWQALSLRTEVWNSDIRAGFNQPPALGKLMGLSENQIANAIGLVMSHSLPLGILDAHREELVMAKNIRFGWVAYDATLACMLARNGFTGPVRVVESDTGIRTALYGGAMDLERLTDFSGWRMRDVKYKTLAADGTLHSNVSATLAIVKEQDLKPEEIAAVHITTGVRSSRHTTTPAKKYPRTAENADHSAFYANALAIKERAFGPDSIRPEKFTDPVVLDLIEKITVSGSSDLGFLGGISEIITTDGRRFEKRVDVPCGLGSSLSDAELESKFREMATAHMSDGQIQDIFDTIWELESVEDLGRLTGLMKFPANR